MGDDDRYLPPPMDTKRAEEVIGAVAVGAGSEARELAEAYRTIYASGAPRR